MSASDRFHFQQFSVSQDRCAMKVGTDGVLLGAWVPLPVCNDTVSGLQQPVKVVDVGTGTGLIALMLAQRLSRPTIQPKSQPKSQPEQTFEITALEPEPLAAAQAQENVAQSPWSKQIQVYPQALATAHLSTADLWVCNPPFFDQKQISPQHTRALARHRSPDFISDFFERASAHLTPQGHIALVLPWDHEAVYLETAHRWGWQWQKRCWVRHSAQHPIKRVLLTFTRAASASAPETQTLCLKEMGPNGWQDSPAYARWASPFYLRYAGPRERHYQSEPTPASSAVQP